MINNFNRYQKGLTLGHLFPKLDGFCACGCGFELISKRKKWFSRACQISALYQFYIIKGDNRAIRKVLFELQEGYCQICGVYDPNWQADHILPVHQGGGACAIDNLQTVCLDCHKLKTLNAIPNSNNVKASCINIFHSSRDGFRAFSEGVSKDVVREI